MKIIKVLFLLAVCNMATPLFSETPTPAISAIEKNTARHPLEAGEYTLDLVSAPSDAFPKGATETGTLIVENNKSGQIWIENTTLHANDRTDKALDMEVMYETKIHTDFMGNTHIFRTNSRGGVVYGKIEKQVNGTLLVKGEGLSHSLKEGVKMETIITPTNNGYTRVTSYYNSKTKQWTPLRTLYLKKVS